MSRNQHTWWDEGVEYGWIEQYERELIRFLEAQFGRLNQEEKICAVFTSLFLKAGHTCLPLSEKTETWAQFLSIEDRELSLLPKGHINIPALEKSPLIGSLNEMKPFVLTNNLLSFRKSIVQEHQLLQWIKSKSVKNSTPDISSYINKNFQESSYEEADLQMVASMLALIKSFLVISGGPGTGKTTTVAKILHMLLSLSDKPLKIALAAPTGKAASRMGEALFVQLSTMDVSSGILDEFPKEAKTIHRLLSGTGQDGLLPPVEKKVLNYDVVVIDEASMIDLSLMYRLFQHLRSDSKLILLGDKFQLASVEAGSVFSDLCRKKGNGFNRETLDQLTKMGLSQELPIRELSPLDDSIVYLTKSYRFGKDSGIGILSEKVKEGEVNEESLQKLFHAYSDINHYEFRYEKADFDRMVNDLISKVEECQRITDPQQMLAFWKDTVWLSALRRGLAGTERLNGITEQQVALRRLTAIENGWYHGRPVIITQNDYGLGLFNGDMGICIRDSLNELWVYVESGSMMKRYKPQRISKYAPSYFLTVHKSQGSEFNTVNLLLPPSFNQVLSRELIYTAITRAKKSCTFYGPKNLLMKGIRNNTIRYTGFQMLMDEY